jgi:hypothetical protein
MQHALPWPLVIRLVHQSVMQQVEENSSYHERSKPERFAARAFGRVPW